MIAIRPKDSKCNYICLSKSFNFRYKTEVQGLKWSNVTSDFISDCPKVIKVVSLVLTLPASSAENERGFSLMKRIKTDIRASMTSETLSDLMSVHLLTPDVGDYDPTGAVHAWLTKSRRSRDHHSSKYDENEAPETLFDDEDEKYFDASEDHDNELSEAEVASFMKSIDV